MTAGHLCPYGVFGCIDATTRCLGCAERAQAIAPTDPMTADTWEKRIRAVHNLNAESRRLLATIDALRTIIAAKTST